jgi:hypothetical protein
MAANYDATEFVDTDFMEHKSPFSSSPGTAGTHRAPTREEVESRVSETHQKLAELKRAQDELERERAGLEEIRRRQMEYQNGRQEMVTHLTRGIGLLDEAEQKSRRDAEQMARTLIEFRDALGKVQAAREEEWSKENFNIELTRALTAIENARMEWNSARLKFEVLGDAKAPTGGAATPSGEAPLPLGARGLGELCKFGLALTWPVAGVGLLILAALLVMLLRR